MGACRPASEILARRPVLTSSLKAAFQIATSAVAIGLGIIVAGVFAHGDLIWAEAFPDRSVWRFVLASQPIFGMGLAIGALAVELFHRRLGRALGLATLVIWVSNAVSFAVIGFLTVITGGM
jgi:hypothetical protein